MNTGAYIARHNQTHQENNRIKLVTIIAIVQATILQNRGFASGYTPKDGPKNSRNAQVGLALRAALQDQLPHRKDQNYFSVGANGQRELD
jgi:hypothetical protein